MRTTLRWPRTPTPQLRLPSPIRPPPLVAKVTPPPQAAPLLHRRRKKKQPKANKEEEEPQPERASRRKKGEAAVEEPDLDDLKKARKAASKAAKKGRSAESSGALDLLAQAASGAGGSLAGGQGGGADDSIKVTFPSDRKDLKKKAGHKNRENQKHASGVWEKYSPTGLWVGEDFCAENFDHSDGAPWATLVFNAVTQKVPKERHDGEWYPSAKDKPRFYEGFSRSIVFVPRIAPFAVAVGRRTEMHQTTPRRRTGHAIAQMGHTHKPYARARNLVLCAPEPVGCWPSVSRPPPCAPVQDREPNGALGHREPKNRS